MLTAIAELQTYRLATVSDFNKLYYTDLRKINTLVLSNNKTGEALMILNGTTLVPQDTNYSFFPDNLLFNATTITVPDKSIKYLHADVYKRIMDYAAADINSIFGTICLYAFKSEQLYGSRIALSTIPSALLAYL
jgi:hypothetical protein